MKELVSSFTLAGMLMLTLGSAAGATPPTLRSLTTTSPSVAAVAPATARNDIDTSVTITGAGFATDATGAMAPTATLGTTPLTNVSFVDSSTLTATVPWGMNPAPTRSPSPMRTAEAPA